MWGFSLLIPCYSPQGSIFCFKLLPAGLHLLLQESRVVASLRRAIASDKATFPPALNSTL